MATKAQIDANRRNAAKSTGPRTAAGKSRVRRNALRHGLCATIPAMHYEPNQQEIQPLLRMLREEHQPVGPTEEILVYKMAEHFFFSKRAATYLTWSLDTRSAKPDLPKLDPALMLRYHTTADRAFYRALAELRKLQKDRKLRQDHDIPEIGSVPQDDLAETAAPEPVAQTTPENDAPDASPDPENLPPAPPTDVTGPGGPSRLAA